MVVWWWWWCSFVPQASASGWQQSRGRRGRKGQELEARLQDGCPALRLHHGGHDPMLRASRRASPCADLPSQKYSLTLSCPIEIGERSPASQCSVRHAQARSIAIAIAIANLRTQPHQSQQLVRHLSEQAAPSHPTASPVTQSPGLETPELKPVDLGGLAPSGPQAYQGFCWRPGAWLSLNHQPSPACCTRTECQGWARSPC